MNPRIGYDGGPFDRLSAIADTLPFAPNFVYPLLALVKWYRDMSAITSGGRT